MIYPAPPSSVDIATGRNPRQFGHTDTDLGLTEMADGLAISLLPIVIISVSPKYAIGPTKFAWHPLFCLVASLRSNRVDAIGATELMFSLAISHRSHRVVPVGPTKIPNVHILN